MKNKVIGILIITIIISIVPSIIFGMDTNIQIGDTDAINSSVGITNRIVGTMQVAGTIISVISLIIIGMRYMFSSVQERAQLKGVLIYWVIGAVLVLATSNILAFVYEILDDVQHEYEDLGIVKQPTCMAVGIKQLKCKDCGKIVEIEVGAVEHKKSTSWDTPVAATCESNGLQTKNCTYCNVVMEERTISKLGHIPSTSWKIAIPATCEGEGTKTKNCTRCNKVMNSETIAATGHNVSTKWEVATAATCTTNGTKVKKCITCSKIINTATIAAVGHNYEWKPSVSATCTREGSKYQQCKNCGNLTNVTTTPALGHNYGSWTQQSAATCTAAKVEKRSCSRCSNVETRNVGSALGHSGSWTEKSAATCTAPKKEQQSCTICGNIETRNSGYSLGHSWGSKNDATANYTAIGNTGKHTYRVYCTRPGCTEYTLKNESCTYEGILWWRKCKYCGQK